MILWLKYAMTRISERMAYRTEFIISMLTMFVLELTAPIVTFIIYQNDVGFPGWTFEQILLIQGIFLLVKGFSFMTFFGIVWNTNFQVKKGTFDLILTKPRNTLYLFICDSFDSEDSAKFIGGMLITGYAFTKVPNLQFENLIFALVFMFLGVCLFLSVGLFFSSFIFRFIQSFRVYEFLDILATFGKYPRSIYPQSVSFIFSYLFPIFIVGVFPVKALFGQFSPAMFLSSAAVLLLLALSLKVWFSTIKNYTSAGG